MKSLLHAGVSGSKTGWCIDPGKWSGFTKLVPVSLTRQTDTGITEPYRTRRADQGSLRIEQDGGTTYHHSRTGNADFSGDPHTTLKAVVSACQHVTNKRIEASKNPVVGNLAPCALFLVRSWWKCKKGFYPARAIRSLVSPPDHLKIWA